MRRPVSTSNPLESALLRRRATRRAGLQLALAAAALAGIAAASPAAAAPGTSDGAQWPTRPVRFVVPYPPGGPLDQVARALAEQLRERELFKVMAGVSMVHIPYAGAAPAQLGLLAGQTDLMFDNLASAAPQIRAGRLEGFAVTTKSRSELFPQLPTVAQSGLPGFDIATWFGVFAPAGTPEAVIERLHAEFARALDAPAMRERLARLGAEASPLSPAEFGAFVREEQQKYARIVKASGAKVD